MTKRIHLQRWPGETQCGMWLSATGPLLDMTTKPSAVTCRRCKATVCWQRKARAERVEAMERGGKA